MEIKGQIILRKGREASLVRFHPWVFSGAVLSEEGNQENGDWVCVRDVTRKSLGFGHYQKGTITVRILSFSLEPPGPDFYGLKIQAAFDQRKIVGVVNPATNCFRLVHGEGDGLAGLIIDIYNGVAVIQAHSSGVQRIEFSSVMRY